MTVLRVNSDQLAALSNKLEKLGSTTLPNVVRRSLNAAALDMKKSTLPDSAKKTFATRDKNFIKAKSRVNFAKGSLISDLKSEVGMLPGKSRGNSDAVENLQEQEYGGNIEHRSWIPTDAARVGGTRTGKLAARNRLGKMKNLVKVSDHPDKRLKQKWIKSAIFAKKTFGANAFVLGNKWRDRQTLSRIDRITYGSGGIKIERTPIYSFKKGRNVAVKGTRFVLRAAHESKLKIEDVFITEARKRFERALR